MSDYLAMAYKDSDYTSVIAVLLWCKCIRLELKLALVLKLWVILSSCPPPLFEHSFWLSAIALHEKAHEDTAMISIQHWNSPWWWSYESKTLPSF